mmetsp:Transcript_118721/g.206233  ORF Transcript_118721/g.206233 Transcript_118721/m.206233 type:complete len:87 (+) Transcript_118721:3-263(+)
MGSLIQASCSRLTKVKGRFARTRHPQVTSPRPGPPPILTVEANHLLSLATSESTQNLSWRKEPHFAHVTRSCMRPDTQQLAPLADG